MKSRSLYLLFLCALLFSGAAVAIGSQVDSPPSLMARSDFLSARNAIEAKARASLAACRGVEGSARDLCKARARADERVRKADLQAVYLGTVASAQDARLARVKAEFDVAKVRCTYEVREARTACLQSVREDRNRALAEARLASI